MPLFRSVFLFATIIVHDFFSIFAFYSLFFVLLLLLLTNTHIKAAHRWWKERSRLNNMGKMKKKNECEGENLCAKLILHVKWNEKSGGERVARSITYGKLLSDNFINL
jgi:hypothetical protein